MQAKKRKEKKQELVDRLEKGITTKLNIRKMYLKTEKEQLAVAVKILILKHALQMSEVKRLQMTVRQGDHKKWTLKSVPEEYSKFKAPIQINPSKFRAFYHFG